MDAIFETHALKCFLALQVIFLVDLVQIFDFLAPLVLLFEVAEVAVNLLLSLSDAVANLPSLLSLLLILHLLDLSQSLMRWDFVWVHALRPHLLLNL